MATARDACLGTAADRGNERNREGNFAVRDEPRAAACVFGGRTSFGYLREADEILERAVAAEREIRADYDRDTIAIYQAYSPVIADAALAAGRFVAPFSFQRMTWIKPSFLWLMHRSNWGQKSGQERVLCVRVKRAGWEKALSMGVLTSYEPRVFASPDEWASEFASAQVHIQWDTERSLRGAALPVFSIQVGLSRHVIREFVEEWIARIEDFTPRVRKMRELLKAGKPDHAKRELPGERVYAVPSTLAKRLFLG